MLEFIIVIALLVFIPMFFHWWITSAYYNNSKTFFGNDKLEDEDSLSNVGCEGTLNDVGQGEQK